MENESGGGGVEKESRGGGVENESRGRGVENESGVGDWRMRAGWGSGE